LISKDSIDEVKNRMDIVDVVNDFITLKKSGQNYKALSPFSNEKTPSFFVVPGKGIFKDFSSGKGGDAITFVMEHEGLTYLEAIRYLAKKYGVEIKEEQLDAAQQGIQTAREALYIVLNFAKEFFTRQLWDTEEGQSIAYTYFKERGFTDQTIKKFELGYSQDQWDAFSKEAISKGYSEDLLEQAGLIIKREASADKAGFYDRFRGRVIFPVHNNSGKVIAFGARILGKDSKQPKYINSPETEVYHKSNVLYGLYQAKQSIRNLDNCYLVEGYTDVISLHQADVENVVSSSGTALTEEQINLIKRFTDNVTVLFDGDAAGIKAALRGIDMILRGGLNVRVVLLPEGEDPDSYSRKMNSTAFKEYLAQHTQDFISFKAGLYAKEAGFDPIRKAASIKEIVGSVAVIPDPVKRSVYIKETSNLLGISESVLLTELNKLLIQERKKKDRERFQQNELGEDVITHDAIPDLLEPGKISFDDLVYLQEKETIRLLLRYADLPFLRNEELEAGAQESLREFLVAELEDVEFTNPVYKEIISIFKQSLQRAETISTDFLISQGSKEVAQTVAELITDRYETSENWEKKYNIHIPKEEELLSRAAESNVLRLKFRIVQKMIEENLQKLKGAKTEEEIDRYFSIHEDLKEIEQVLTGSLGIVITRQ
jgi:DNA primase